ncbi:MAG: DUF4197 domain-containing protein [Bacteroidales bacterium]|jgi:hypothetical protein|nr:DUF4197 domain-containing protein [Bacteroidales bacterium]
MKKTVLFLLVITWVSCAELEQIAGTITTPESTATLTKSDIAKGLKEALRVGTDTATHQLSKINGYYKDEVVKILLPREANVILENVNKIPGGEQLVDKVILGINRAAEDASKEAAPIFKQSITSMSIADALGILKGADTAATHYLRKTTYQQLYQLYQPKIKASVNKKLLGNLSTAETWNNLTGAWNKFAHSMVGQIGGYQPVTVNLEDYLTRKALDGLFIKIAEEERQIRKDPVARVTDILEKVFG